MTVYFLVGPTASGKTEFSLGLATKLNAEIISCDSMCVYNRMDILTSKPSKIDRSKIRHHLIDITSPTKEFNVAEYRRLALAEVEDIFNQGKTPLFVGGSGLYIKSIIDGLFTSVGNNPEFRKKQEQLAEKYGNIYLFNKLKRLDPVTSRNIHPNNVRRVIRALEIYYVDKKMPSELKENTEPIKYKVKIFGLDVDRDTLYKNIGDRVERMFRTGIVDEVQRLSKMRLSRTAKSALGYKEVLGYLKGRYSLIEAKELLKRNTRHFAKRQMTWFKGDSRIKWIEHGKIVKLLNC